MQEKKNCQYIC